MIKHPLIPLAILTLLFLPPFSSASFAASGQPPAAPVKLIFVHHSCGENWLADGNGNLGIDLMNSNYFVSDTYYGWEVNGDNIGDRTDIGHWWDWFRGGGSSQILNALYGKSSQDTYFTRMGTDPGGENTVIMFKSCFPNSALMGDPGAAPTAGNNPLRGQDSGSEYMTVANAKGIYNDILEYFRTRQDKLFIAVTAPPLLYSEYADNARAFNNWLVNDWLKDYPYANVAVFDFFNVLTSSGGGYSTSDAGSETGNHHRWWNHRVQHIQTVNSSLAAYPDWGGDDHPSSAGNMKAASEFVPLLNNYYNRWRNQSVCIDAGQDLIFSMCARYRNVSYSFVMNYYAAPDSLFWEMDVDSFTETGGAANCTDVGENVDFDMCVNYGGARYGFVMKYQPMAGMSDSAFWEIDADTFVEIP